ncbi:MAG: bifunctional oligoribonuclease/PAP phosphatase NrnA [Cellulosilyticum sp.]|nr:bifunctional oligoribonuclease/PAP phosphatase NrnA [Cellulosilyticum sp.]
MKDTILSQIKSAKGIILGAHTNPDGDAVGALVGMATLCGFLHIPHQILLEKIPHEFEDLLENMPVAHEASISYDTFISVDCGDLERLGKFQKDFEKAEVTINIDHHGTNTFFAQYNEVQRNASATCEIVYDLICLADCPLTEVLARSLYTGILTDTGGFMHSSTTPRTHEIVAGLMRIPFPFTKVYYKHLYEKSKTATMMEAIAMSHMEQLWDKPYYMTYVTAQEMAIQDATKEDLGAIVSSVKNIKGCDLAIFMYPLDETHYKVSFRSNPPYDVAALSVGLGGGGHIRAAGATIEGHFEEAVARIHEALKQVPLDETMKGSLC